MYGARVRTASHPSKHKTDQHDTLPLSFSISPLFVSLTHCHDRLSKFHKANDARPLRKVGRRREYRAFWSKTPAREKGRERERGTHKCMVRI